MKIVFMDIKSLGEDLDYSVFDSIGEVVKYDFTSVAEMPKELEKHLNAKNLITGKVLVFAAADMDVNCEIRKNVLILTENEFIHGAADSLTAERRFSGFKELPVDYKKFIFEAYEVKSISNIAVDTMVVGGIFRADVLGVETPFCAFTNAYKGRINRLKDVLNKLVNNEEISEDLLFEEETEERVTEGNAR